MLSAVCPSWLFGHWLTQIQVQMFLIGLIRASFITDQCQNVFILLYFSFGPGPSGGQMFFFF